MYDHAVFHHCFLGYETVNNSLQPFHDRNQEKHKYCKYSELPSLYSQAASQVAPSPAGEGWGEENKIKTFLYPLIQPPPVGEGFRQEIK